MSEERICEEQAGKEPIDDERTGVERMSELDVDQRREKILELVSLRNKVKVSKLSRIFKTSEVTIRNDLSELEAAGLLERVHGGAVSTYRTYYNMTFNDRMKTNADEKRRMAASVAAQVTDGDTLLMSSGTTTLYLARELKSARNVTVVTNSMAIAQEMGLFRDVSVILLGGNLNAQYLFTYGDDTLNQLRHYKADRLFLSVDGVSPEDGVTTYHHLEAEVNRQMIARAKRTIIVADHTKIGRTGFAHIDSVDNIDCLVTSSLADSEVLQAIRERGVEVRIV
jgi:DeoR family fructose operon transcriptional repressor